MDKYIDIILTETGVFCVAPPWEIAEGDLICLPNALTGEKAIQKVISVVTDNKDGHFIKMVEKYVGYPLPKITEKFKSYSVEWGEENVSE